MAKISIQYDTKEKTLAVTMDGKAVDNVAGAYLGKGYSYDEPEDYRCELTMMTQNEDDDYYTMTRIVASDTPAGQKLGDAPESKEVPGFKVAESATQFDTDVADFFKKNREAEAKGKPVVRKGK